MPKLIRITTVPIALKYLLAGQMRFMKEKGFEVIMVSADGEGREDVIKQEGCEHRIIPMTRKITPFADIRSLWKLYKLFKKERPDIVHSHTPKAGLLSMIAAKLAGVKIRVHTIAGLRFMTSTGATRKLLIQMEKLTARFATQVWPNSFSLLKYINDNKLVPSKKLDVIGSGSSNGIRLSRFSSGALNAGHLQEVKKLVRYDVKYTYLLCVGRIVRDKGIEELTRSFLRLYEQNNLLRLILVGSFEDELDPLNAEIKKIIRDHPAVILTGWREDVEYFMPLAFALVHPSYREGFPNVLLQAGAMSCPIICSRIEGNVDVVEDKITGLLFEAQNEESLYQQLKIALSNPDMLKSYSENLLKKIQQQFDQSVLHQKVLDKYNSLLNFGDLKA